jgi:hypothetical protein
MKEPHKNHRLLPVLGEHHNKKRLYICIILIETGGSVGAVVGRQEGTNSVAWLRHPRGERVEGHLLMSISSGYDCAIASREEAAKIKIEYGHGC